MPSELPRAKGRGSQINPPTRFGLPYHVPDLEHVEHDEDYLASLHNRPTEYFPDNSKTIVTENDSPDVGFRYSINPYRGCSHGCSYCYARPYHEFLDLNAGLDFETKIFVKEKAPALFREFLCRADWQPEVIGMSGVTDCYQPAERHFRVTRGCLEVAVEARQPMGIITKNALVLRDLDLLRDLAADNLVHVNVSITTLNAELARSMEPRTSTPEAKLRAIETLAAAGIPVRVMVAPIIPGLTDSEIPAVLTAAKAAGARDAGYTMLRLPFSVKPVFLEWLEREQPAKKDRIEARIRSVRDGKLNESQFGKRMRGAGEMAEQIRSLFKLFKKKCGLDGGLPEYDCGRFRAPREGTGQGRLF
jgi:DNA repair photolyase